MIESSGCLFYFAGYFQGPLKPPMWGEVGVSGPNESGGTPREEVRTSTCRWSHGVFGQEDLDQQISIEGEDLVRKKIFLNFSIYNQMLEICTGNGWRGIGGVPWKKQAELGLTFENDGPNKWRRGDLDINQQNVAQKYVWLIGIQIVNSF